MATKEGKFNNAAVLGRCRTGEHQRRHQQHRHRVRHDQGEKDGATGVNRGNLI